MAAETKPQRLFLRIWTRRGLSFDSEVQSLTGFNDKGEFDVLQQHSQFISLIKDKIIVRLLDGKQQEIPVDNAIMRVKDEIVQVFVGIKQQA